MAGKNFQLIYIHPFKRRHLPLPLYLPRTESYYCPCFPPPRRELISQQIYYYKFCRKLLYKVRRVEERKRERGREEERKGRKKSECGRGRKKDRGIEYLLCPFLTKAPSVYSSGSLLFLLLSPSLVSCCGGVRSKLLLLIRRRTRRDIYALSPSTNIRHPLRVRFLLL